MAVKRPYRSALRDAQARSTRRTIVDAAARLFVQQGYAQTTVDAIAAAAGVSRKTVFASVGGKAQTLKLALDWATVGDDEPVPMLERPRIRQAREEPDARAILVGFAGMAREVNARIAPLVAVLEAAAGLEPELAELAEDRRAQRLRGMLDLARQLDARGALKAELTVSAAADLLWVCHDPAIFHRLVVERRWSADRYQRWLADALTGMLIDPGYRPRRGDSRTAARPRQGG